VFNVEIGKNATERLGRDFISMNSSEDMDLKVWINFVRIPFMGNLSTIRYRQLNGRYII
jgi:hypothetical protein